MTCKRCGKCCKTHIMGVSRGEDLELLKLRKGYQKTIEHNGHTWMVFRIACKYVVGTVCRIYRNKRPALCDKFPEKGFLELWGKVNPNCGYVEAWKKGLKQADTDAD